MNNEIATPLVSVVIAAYNSANFIRDCLNSIIAQTYKHMEIIVVDDGSVDDTVAIIKAEYIDKIRLIAQSNQKVAAARHAGLQHVCGEFVAFCDHDDLWLPDKIEKQVAFFKLFPECCMLHSDAEELRELDGTKKLYSVLHPFIKRNDTIFPRMIRDFAVPLFSTVMIRSAFLKEHDIQFIKLPPGVDDLGVFLQILMCGGNIRFLDEPLVIRRMHQSNQSSNYLQRFQRRVTLYTYLLERYRHKVKGKYLCDIRWGLADAAYRVADTIGSRDSVGDSKKLYRIAWINNKNNIKSLIKMFILTIGGSRFLFKIKN